MRIGKFIAALFSALIIFVYSVECYASAADSSPEKAVGAAIPERHLTGKELELYRKILQNVQAISEGKQSAKTFYINVSSPFKTKADYEKALKKAMFFIMNYTPEYSYWIDSSGSLVYDTTRCGVVYGISPAYQKRGDKNMISTDGLYEAKKAFANAQSIVNLYQDRSDYEKVLAYAEEICRLNVYNHTAADANDNGEYSQKNINPWRLVYVFDRNPNTNVVCSGYAHAFQYLCDLGGVECHYVTGKIKEGFHAWNIVVIDGVNYLVDLTACDGFTENVVEQHHPMVMNSVASSTGDGVNTYFSGGGYTASNFYKYSDDEMEYLPESLRVISTKSYSKGGFDAAVFIKAFIPIGGLILYVAIRSRRAQAGC